MSSNVRVRVDRREPAQSGTILPRLSNVEIDLAALRDTLDARDRPPHSDLDVSTATCYVYKSGATYANAQRYNEFTLFAPVSNSTRDYFAALFSNSSARSSAVLSLFAMFLARPGLSVPHGSCTRVGSWTNDVSTSSDSGGYRYSTTAGDTISASVTGSTVGAFVFCATNGGYAVVSIDGSYTAANLLPEFAATDYANGLCRAEDVGRRYVQCYAASGRTDGFAFADNLSTGTHTVTIEVCGTKRAAASAARVYVESIIGCASGDTIGTTNVKMLPVLEINNQASSWSAHEWVVEWAPAGSSDYQFIGDTHADGTLSKEVTTSWALYCDATDQTAMSAGTYQSASRITIRHVSTVAHKADLNTAVLTKNRTYTIASNRDLPLMVQCAVTWSATGNARTEYPVMLPVGSTVNQLRTMSLPFTTVEIGGIVETLPKAFNNSAYKKRYGRDIVFASPQMEVFARLVSRWPDVGQLFGDFTARHQDRTSLDAKGYVQTIAGAGPAYASGDVVMWTYGFGALRVF